MLFVRGVEVLVDLFGCVGGYGSEELKCSVECGVEGVLCGFAFGFAVRFGVVESVFDGFEVLVAELMPCEVADFFGCGVELALFEGRCGQDGGSFEFA